MENAPPTAPRESVGKVSLESARMGKRVKTWASMTGHFKREAILMIGFPVVFVIVGLAITILVQTLRGARAFH
jgi:hypothetical protein